MDSKVFVYIFGQFFDHRIATLTSKLKITSFVSPQFYIVSKFLNQTIGLLFFVELLRVHSPNPINNNNTENRQDKEFKDRMLNKWFNFFYCFD